MIINYLSIGIITAILHKLLLKYSRKGKETYRRLFLQCGGNLKVVGKSLIVVDILIILFWPIVVIGQILDCIIKRRF